MLIPMGYERYMQDKWKEALNHWPKWKESVDKAREDIIARYGDVESLLAKAKEEFEARKDTFKDDPIGEFLEENVMRIEIMNVLEKPAHAFIQKEMHLPQGSDLHWAFVDIWMDSACPALKINAKRDFEIHEESLEGPLDLDTPRRRVSAGSGKTDGRVWHIVRWYSDEATPLEVAAFLQKKPELFSADVRHPGGRPREEFRIDIESIICYMCVFRSKKARLSEETGRPFGVK